jgi:hypothetical protein
MAIDKREKYDIHEIPLSQEQERQLILMTQESSLGLAKYSLSFLHWKPGAFVLFMEIYRPTRGF